MRFFRWWSLFGSLCVSAALLVAFGGLKNPYADWSGGENVAREYYLYSPSSQATIQTEVELCDGFSITGEKAVFVFSTEKDADRYAMRLLKMQNAKVVFEESIAGARSIYAHAKRLGAGARIGGALVNLHVVVSGKCVQVGTPMIFGGY